MAGRPKVLEDHVKYLRQNLKENIEYLDKRLYEFKLLSYLVEGKRFDTFRPRVRPWLTGGAVKLEVEVKSFRDVLPLLERLAEWGYDFNESDDAPTYNTRYYRSDRIVIDATLVEGDANCRRVIVGYEQPSPPRPIYGFDCGGAQDLPDPNPNPAVLSDETSSA